jgi:hypothetical protein
MQMPSINLTREQQIKLGLQLLNVAPQDRTKWRWRLERALDEMDEAHALAAMYASERSKPVTKARGSLRQALERLRVAERKLRDLGWTPLPIDQDAIAQSLAATEPPRRPKVTREPVSRFGAFARQYKGAMLAHWDAVKLAHHLLLQRGTQIVTTRGVNWHRLAAILYGDIDIDLFQHLRRYLRDQTKSPRI